MVTRKRFRTVLNALALYTIAALVIGYFGVNAYSGNRGLRAKQDLDQQIAELNAELDALLRNRFFLPISRHKEPRPRLSPSASALRRFRLLGK